MRTCRKSRISVLAISLLLAAPAAAAAIPAAASARSGTTCQPWNGTQPPNPGGANYLYAASVLSGCQAWAVGQAQDYHNLLAMNWNGTSWNTTTTPNPSGPNTEELEGVAALSPTNAWAVGSYVNGIGQCLALHWKNGTWTQTPTPEPGGGGHFCGLFGVAAITRANAWAVGNYNNGTAAQTLIEHWNGTKWSVVPSPSPGGPTHYNRLVAVSVVSPNDIWAVGSYSTATAYRLSLIEHWNGTKWSVVRSPSPGGGGSGITYLLGVSGTSATNVWAVGWCCGISPLILHWGGKAWREVHSAGRGAGTQLNAVTSISPDDAWAVGFYENGNTENFFTEHWNGRAWRWIATPGAPDGGFDTLLGVSGNSPDNIWAVGGILGDPFVQVWLMHWNGTAWQQ
jgi:hypothetical protein